MVRLSFDDVVDWRWIKRNSRQHTLWVKLANDEEHEIVLTPKQGSKIPTHNRSA